MTRKDRADLVILGCLVITATTALIGLTAAAGIAGLYFGVVLVVFGVVGAWCAEDIARGEG